jgi:hypothetical protein
MNSHEHARVLRGIADCLESKPEFALPDHWSAHLISLFNCVSYYAQKDLFLAAARALGEFEKKYTDSELEIACPANGGGRLLLRVNRDVVCRLVKPAQPAEYECDPLLLDDEV